MVNPGIEVGTVAEIWRYPVQSMQGEVLTTAEIAPQGVVGDRAYGIVDPDAGMVVSSAQGRKKWRDIVRLSARYLSMPANDGSKPPVEITLPDGSTLRNDQDDIDKQLTTTLGAQVHLADKRAEDKRSEYGHAPLHLVTTASLRQFAAHYPEGRFAPARFRSNIVIDTGGATGFLEQGWIERRFRIGDTLEIAVTEHCKRCVMTTLPQGDLPMDPAILHTATQHNDTHVGIYAAVLRPGRIAMGDGVRLLD